MRERKALSASSTSFKSQAKTLLLFIACGFLLVCIIAFLALFGLKDEYETSFVRHLQNTHSLQSIQAFYAKLASYPASTHKQHTSNTQTQDMSIQQSALKPESNTLDSGVDSSLYEELQRVEQAWIAYTAQSRSKKFITQLKQFYQQLFLSKEVARITELQAKKQKLIAKLDSKLKATQSLLHSPTIIEHSAHIHALLNELSHNDMQIAQTAYKIANSLYNATLWLLFTCAFCVSFGTLYFASLVLGFVRSIHHKLQQTIEAQTRTLKETNQNLQHTIAQEIEQSRKKDQIMYQQARLASMGEMIQNIAHQWRQPLNSLIILFQSFKLKYEQQKLTDDFVAKETEFALKIAKNMSETIENFRNFFRPNLARERFSLTQSIQDSIRLISPTLEQNHIRVIFTHSREMEMYGYENAFSQVVLNIIKNSQDILAQRASTTATALNTDSIDSTHISTSHTASHNGLVRIILQDPQHHNALDSKELESTSSEFAELILMDNGGGIQLKEIDKIFEPYFTTKHKSIGTGIGLYMVRQIVERQMGGSIEVSNDEWEYNGERLYGAIFMIRFPLYFEG